MKSFSIDRDNNITAFTNRKDAEAGAGNSFRSEAELHDLTASWPASRLVEIWNSIPGFVPVKKFTNRKTAVLRIWKAIQSLDGGGAAHVANLTSDGRPATSRSTRARNKARANQTGDPTRTPIAEVVARRDSKTAKVLAMLRRTEGATLQQIMSVTGWQAHSVRGFVSGTLGKKLHLTVVSAKGEDGQRRYSVTA
jgi:Protein of unknown function (DUF3489)